VLIAGAQGKCLPQSLPIIIGARRTTSWSGYKWRYKTGSGYRWRSTCGHTREAVTDGDNNVRLLQLVLRRKAIQNVKCVEIPTACRLSWWWW
jgi:hypothetical protein